MLISVLGPLTVTCDGGEVDIRQQRQRQLLATLALKAPARLPTDVLSDLVWGTELPANPGTVRTQVWALRREARLTPLITRDQRGYGLSLRPGELDAHVFLAAAADGLRLLVDGDKERAAGTLDLALAMWRAQSLDDVPTKAGMAPERERLLTERAAAQDAVITARLGLGQHHRVLGDLRERVAREPEREHSWAQLMLAQYRCGRRADALDTYTRAWGALKRHYGIEPGPELRRMQELVLRDDPVLDARRGVYQISGGRFS